MEIETDNYKSEIQLEIETSAKSFVLSQQFYF